MSAMTVMPIGPGVIQAFADLLNTALGRLPRWVLTVEAAPLRLHNTAITIRAAAYHEAFRIARLYVNGLDKHPGRWDVVPYGGEPLGRAVELNASGGRLVHL